MALFNGRGRLTGGRVLREPFRPGLLPVFLIAAAFLAWWLWPSSHQATAARIPTPVAGTRTLAAPLDLCIVIDESSSTDDTDPSGRRHTEAVGVATWMGRYSENKRDEICLVQFANGAAGHAPVPVGKAPAMLTKAFARFAKIGTGTVLAPAVGVVEREMTGLRGRRVIVIISDGQLNHEGPQEIRALIRRLRTVADDVFFVGLNGDGKWGKTQHLYENNGLAGIYTLDSFAPNVFAQTLAQIVLRETGQQVRNTA